MLQENFKENVKKFPSDMWNESLEESVKINIYQKKVWGRSNIYTRALNIECPTVIKDQIEQMITRVTMKEVFKKIFPEAMLIPHSKNALKAFQIDSENFINMKNSILHATTKFYLYN